MTTKPLQREPATPSPAFREAVAGESPAAAGATLEERTFEVRAVDTDTREVTGIAAPYGEEITVHGFFASYRERFEPGAFDNGRDDVMLFYGHDEPIGLITERHDTDDGHVITARISETARGNEVYTLLRDKVLRKFSVGFFPVEHRIEGEDTDDPVRVRTRVDLREVSVVPIPAYEGAAISEVRAGEPQPNTERNTDMTVTVNEPAPADLAELRESISDLSRSVDVLREEGVHASDAAAPFPCTYRSVGEYVRGLARGDDEARDLYAAGVGGRFDDRAYTGGTTDDSVVDPPAWVGDLTTIIDKGRRVLNLFGSAGLPSEGMQVEYAKLEADTTSVTEQAAEGDDLAFGHVSIGTATAPVKTYGGYSSLTRQEVERSRVNILDTTWRALAAKYGQTTEGAVRAAVNAAAADPTVATGAHGIEGDLSTFAGWVDFLVDAAVHLDDKGLVPEFAIVDAAMFKAVANMQEGTDGPFLLDRDNGRISVTGLSGSILSLPLVLANSVTTPVVGSSTALTTYEGAGAPVRLQDSNIVNLSGDYSLYGYMSTAMHDSKALVVPTVAAG